MNGLMLLLFWHRCPLVVALTTVRPFPSDVDISRRHGGNCGLNASPKGDAQEAYSGQSSAGQHINVFIPLQLITAQCSTVLIS